MNHLKKALVLGATGSMGSALVYELVNRGVEVTAFARSGDQLNKLFGNQPVKVTIGDVFQQDDVKKAAEGIDVVFHAINIPYPEWQEKQPLLLTNILEAVKKTGTKLVMIDNIYAYGRSYGVPVTEEVKKKPHTKKGNIRLQLEQMAKQSRVPLLITHLPDFYGPNAGSTLLNYTFQAMIQNKKARYIGNQMLAREFIYTPDGAKAIVELAFQNRFDGENWNIPGAGTITGTDIIRIAKQVTGYNKKVSTVSKNMIRFIGIFDSFMREYVEMYYLNEEPVVLNGDKYERAIGPVPKTPYEEGIKQTLLSIKNNSLTS